MDSMNHDKLFKNLIIDSRDFDMVCEKLNEVHGSKIRGKYFEWFAKLIFLNDPRYANFTKECWLLDELPESIREYLEIPSNDIGIDLVIQTHTDAYIAVQAKYRRNVDCIIDWTKLSTFFGLTFGLTNKFTKGLFFTNTRSPNKYIKNHDNVILVLNHCLEDISKNTFIKISKLFKRNSEELITYTPKDYQEVIINHAKEYFNNHDKGRLYMPCGTGKTLVCYWIAMNLKHKKRICIVVPSLHLLSQMYSVWIEMKKCKYLLVGSDAEIKTCEDTGLLLTTQQSEIEEYLSEFADDMIIITTYQSSLILSNACQKINYEMDLIIFDEAHKTVGNMERDFSCLLKDENISTRKRLFTTATEKIYSGDNDDILSMDDTEVFGGVIYSYSFKNAIENGQLCDYQVICPLINDEGFWKVVKKNKYIIDKSIRKDPIESRYYMTAYLLCSNIVEKGLTHILTFNNTNENARIIHEILKNMLKIMNIECNCYHLTGESTMKKRRKVIGQFVNDKVAIISSAKIFQEGINIPIIDCVCFVDNKLAVIDIIQSIGRTLRIHKGKKLGYVIVPVLLNIEKTGNNIFDIDSKEFLCIRNILKALGTIDTRMIDEFVAIDHKHNGNGKFVLNADNVEISTKAKMDINELIEKVDEIVYNRHGIVTWYRNLEKVEEYILVNNKRPSTEDNDTELNKLGRWISKQHRDFRYQTSLMQNEDIYNKWNKFVNKYKEYLRNNQDQWDYVINEVDKYIQTNNKRPSQHDANEDVRFLGQWISNQQKRFKDETKTDENKSYFDKWNELVTKHSKHFDNSLNDWYDILQKVSDYINAHKKRPSHHDKDTNVKILGDWIQHNQTNFANVDRIMKNDEIRNSWAKFLNENSEYFKTANDTWNEHLEDAKKYIDANEKSPSTHSDDKEIRSLGQWISHQKKYYKTKTSVMKDAEKCKIWKDFADEYKDFL